MNNPISGHIFSCSLWWEVVYSFLASALSASYLNLAALRLSAWQTLVLSAHRCRCPKPLFNDIPWINSFRHHFAQFIPYTLHLLDVPQLAPSYIIVIASCGITLPQNTLNLVWYPTCLLNLHKRISVLRSLYLFWTSNAWSRLFES